MNIFVNSLNKYMARIHSDNLRLIKIYLIINLFSIIYNVLELILDISGFNTVLKNEIYLIIIK